MEYFNFLPEEITLDILSRVPTESILECKSVCKTWNHLVSHHPSFNKMHLHHLSTAEDSSNLGFLAFTRPAIGENLKYHYFEYNKNHESTTPIQGIRRFNITPPFSRYIYHLDFIGSYNGLTCIVAYSSVYICNPVTREYILLPGIKIEYRGIQYWTTGFGYVAATDEYKVIRVLMRKSVEVHMYTLGSGNGWRNLENINFEFQPNYSCRQGIFANGTVYWLDIDFDRIVTFNLAEEKFCEDLLPPLSPPESEWEYQRIGVMDGFLFISIYVVEEGVGCYDIWLLKKKNGNHDMNGGEEHQSLVWCREFRVDDDELLAITKSGSVLTFIQSYLNIYDPKFSSSKRLVDFKELLLQIIPHKNTLVSLKELGEEDSKVMESVEVKETESYD